MLKEKIIDKALRKGIETDRSRCLRMRFNGNSCAKCLEQCRRDAISIHDYVSIDTDICTECMLCVSACPSDCFRIKGADFYSLLGRLRKIGQSVTSPVLGCNTRTGTFCHLRTSCFGFLSEEHLMALSLSLQNEVQIDAAGCAECGNGFIVDILTKRLGAVAVKTSARISEKIKLVKSRRALDFQEMSYDRRGFFKAFRNSTFLHAFSLFDNEDPEEGARVYSAKRLPFKRELLNRAIRTLHGEARSLLLRTSYYTVNVSEACSDCFACVGMCPTGALKTEETDGGRGLLFGSFLCSGCGLCMEFCIEKALALRKGFSGNDPFEFYDRRREWFCEVQAESSR
jgi:ferredoxin